MTELPSCPCFIFYLPPDFCPSHSSLNYYTLPVPKWPQYFSFFYGFFKQTVSSENTLVANSYLFMSLLKYDFLRGLLWHLNKVRSSSYMFLWAVVMNCFINDPIIYWHKTTMMLLLCLWIHWVRSLDRSQRGWLVSDPWGLDYQSGRHEWLGRTWMPGAGMIWWLPP